MYTSTRGSCHFAISKLDYITRHGGGQALQKTKKYTLKEQEWHESSVAQAHSTAQTGSLEKHKQQNEQHWTYFQAKATDTQGQNATCS